MCEYHNFAFAVVMFRPASPIDGMRTQSQSVQITVIVHVHFPAQTARKPGPGPALVISPVTRVKLGGLRALCTSALRPFHRPL